MFVQWLEPTGITPEFLGVASGLIFFIAVIPYIIDIFRGNTKPNRTAYVIWAIVQSIVVASYIASGATTTIFMIIATALSTFIILGLSIKRGMGGHSPFEYTCLFLAVVAIIAWVGSNNPALALYASTLAYLIGYLPIIKKSWQHPHTENTLSWGLTGLASWLNILALTTLAPEISLLPLVCLTMDSLIAVLLIFSDFRPFRRLKQPT